MNLPVRIKWVLVFFFVGLFHSSLTSQITELSSRLDTMETSIKKDIRNILEILQNPAGMSRGKSIETFDKLNEPQHSQFKEQMAQEKLLMAMQPSESEFSFELCMDPKRQLLQQSAATSQRMPTTSMSQVHRSISQPECTNTAAEKNLLRYLSCLHIRSTLQMC